jgi:hypothetical protein
MDKTLLAKDGLDNDVLVVVTERKVSAPDKTNLHGVRSDGFDMQTVDGKTVYKHGKGLYKIFDDGDITYLTSDDPDAP